MFERLTKELWGGCPIEEFSHFVELDGAEAKIIGEGCAHPVVAGKSIDRLAAYEDSGLSPEEVQKMARAKADGRLVVLPCKPGDVVYAVSGCLFYRDDSAPYTPCEVVVIKKTKRGVIMHLRPLCEDSAGTRYHRWFPTTCIGKTVFLTREEAEKALQEGLRC